MSRSEAGRKGAQALNSDETKKSEAARKAAQTRGHESFVEMGRKGGQSSHGGGRKSGSSGGRGSEE
jgi:general stress protein YciG